MELRRGLVLSEALLESWGIFFVCHKDPEHLFHAFLPPPNHKMSITLDLIIFII